MQDQSISMKDICTFLSEIGVQYHLEEKPEIKILGFCPLNDLKTNSITWIRKKYKLPIDALNQFNDILLFAEFGTEVEGLKIPVIFVDEVHRTFFRVTEEFFGYLNPEKRVKKIEATAVVETDLIGRDVYIGHHTYVSKDTSIGDNVTIMHNVTICGKVAIGDDSFIESGTVIGDCGFGYMTNEEGNKEIVPHYAGVRIGRNVRIGANNTISRGCLSDTVIEDGVKTADLVCISHNDIIKQNVMITCGTAIAGSTTIGENSWIAPGVTINNAVDIGQDAYIGIGSVVATRVRKNKKVFGNPAKYIN